MDKISEIKYLQIDPLALLLPLSLYPKIIEGKNPHVPKVQDVVSLLKQASPAERQECVSRVETLVAYTRVFQEAVQSIKQ